MVNLKEVINISASGIKENEISAYLENTISEDNEAINSYTKILKVIFINLKNDETINIEETYIYGSIPDDNMTFSISCKIKYNEEYFELNLRSLSYENIETFYLDILGENNKDNLNNSLYDLKIKIKNLLLKYFKDIYWLKDLQNVKISTKLNSIIYEIENSYRAFINKIMIKKHNFNWYEELAEDTLKKTSDEYSKWYIENYPNFGLNKIKLELFNLPTDALINLLKESTSEKKYKRIYKQISSIKAIYPKGILIEEVLKLKSIWEKQGFDSILGVNFQRNWDDFFEYRKKIAHNRLISREDEDEMEKLNTELELNVGQSSKEKISFLATKKNMKGNLSKKLLLENIEEKIKEINSDAKVIDKDTSNLKIELIYKSITFNLNIKKENVEFIYVEISSEDLKINKQIYELKIAMKEIICGFYYDYSIYWLEDFQNKKMIMELYKKVNEVENQLRAIINNLAMRINGKKPSNKNLKNENSEYAKVDNYVNNFLTDDLIKELKKINYKVSLEEIKRDILNLKEIEKEETSYEEQIKALYNKINRSCFDAFFNKDFEEEWKEFNNRRNVIAHNKIVCYDFYEESNKKFEKIKEVLDKVELKINKKIKAYEDEMMKEWIKEYEKEQEDIEEEYRCKEAGIESLKSDDEYIERIEEHDNYIEFVHIIEEQVKKLKNSYEELEYSLEEFTDIFTAENISELKNVFKVIFEIISEVKPNDAKLLEKYFETASKEEEINFFITLINKEIKEVIELIKRLINDCYFDNYFEEEKIYFKYKDLKNNIIEIKSYGFFCPDKGSSNNIYFSIYVNDKKIEDIEGEIYISYGDYDVVDDTFYNPSVEDELLIDFKVLNKKLKEMIEELINKVNNYVERLQEEI